MHAYLKDKSVKKRYFYWLYFITSITKSLKKTKNHPEYW